MLAGPLGCEPLALLLSPQHLSALLQQRAFGKHKWEPFGVENENAARLLGTQPPEAYPCHYSGDCQMEK